ELRVELHRARPQRVEPRVDRVIQLGQVHEVANDLRLVELWQSRRGHPPRGRRDAVESVFRRMRDLVAAAARPRPLEQGGLERLADDTHRAAPVPTGAVAAGAVIATATSEPAISVARAEAKSAISASVVTSVAQTRRAS